MRGLQDPSVARRGEALGIIFLVRRIELRRTPRRRRQCVEGRVSRGTGKSRTFGGSPSDSPLPHFSSPLALSSIQLCAARAGKPIYVEGSGGRDLHDLASLYCILLPVVSCSLVSLPRSSPRPSVSCWPLTCPITARRFYQHNPRPIQFSRSRMGACGGPGSGNGAKVRGTASARVGKATLASAAVRRETTRSLPFFKRCKSSWFPAQTRHALDRGREVQRVLVHILTHSKSGFVATFTCAHRPGSTGVQELEAGWYCKTHQRISHKASRHAYASAFVSFAIDTILSLWQVYGLVLAC
ncbi:hypothetical protein C8R45DRAFT_302806 [Mycena sanguinolenta]|nr:hypothetical protein C8R45DRAFT_302806 [Mycena sanguinolenta]